MINKIRTSSDPVSVLEGLIGFVWDLKESEVSGIYKSIETLEALVSESEDKKSLKIEIQIKHK